MSRAPRSPRIDLAQPPPAAPAAGAWQRHGSSQRHRTRGVGGAREAGGPGGGEAVWHPPLDLAFPTGSPDGTRADAPSEAIDSEVAVLDGAALSTADAVAEGASALRFTPGRATPGGATPGGGCAAGAGVPTAPEPVRLVVPTVPSPFAPGREVAFARVQGDLLARLGVRHGDHVALLRRDTAEPGDLAAVLDATGRAGLWRVYPERDELRLTTGDPACARRSGRRPRVQGVVVAVHRSFAAQGAPSRRATTRSVASQPV